MSILSKNIIDKPHLSPDEISRVPFNVVPDEKGNVRFSVPALSKLLSAEEISAQVWFVRSIVTFGIQLCAIL